MTFTQCPVKGQLSTAGGATGLAHWTSTTEPVEPNQQNQWNRTGALNQHSQTSTPRPVPPDHWIQNFLCQFGCANLVVLVSKVQLHWSGSPDSFQLVQFNCSSSVGLVAMVWLQSDVRGDLNKFCEKYQNMIYGLEFFHDFFNIPGGKDGLSSHKFVAGCHCYDPLCQEVYLGSCRLVERTVSSWRFQGISCSFECFFLAGKWLKLGENKGLPSACWQAYS